MQRFFLFLTAIAAWAAVSCSSPKGNTVQTVIDIEKAGLSLQEVPLSEYASEIAYIPLEAPDSIPIGSGDFLVSDTAIYITDFRNKILRQFDLQGRYLRSIGTAGRGPEEYLSVRNVHINPVNGNLEICDEITHKIVVYDQQGKYLRNIPFPGEISGAGYLVLDGFVAGAADTCFLSLNYMALNKPEYAFFDAVSGNILQGKSFSGKAFRPYREPAGEKSQEKETTGFIIIKQDPIHLLGEKIRLFSQDTIYTFDSGLNETAAYYLKKGKYAPDENEGEDNGIHIFKIQESGDCIFLNCNFTDLTPSAYRNHPEIQHISGVYDKSEERLRFLNADTDNPQSGFRNDLDGGFRFWPQYICGNRMYALYTPSEFIRLSRNCRSERANEIAASLTEDSNPVVVAVTLK